MIIIIIQNASLLERMADAPSKETSGITKKIITVIVGLMTMKLNGSDVNMLPAAILLAISPCV